MNSASQSPLKDTVGDKQHQEASQQNEGQLFSHTQLEAAAAAAAVAILPARSPPQILLDAQRKAIENFVSCSKKDQGRSMHNSASVMAKHAGVLQDVLQKIFPVWRSGSLRCCVCDGWLALSPIIMHDCTKHVVVPKELIDLTGRVPRCKLCKQYCRAETHRCKILQRMFIDLTAMMQWDSESWSANLLMLLRDAPGHWVVIFPHPGPGSAIIEHYSLQYPHAPVCRHHLIVAKSEFPDAGMGAFTVTGFKVKAEPVSLPAISVNGSWTPALTDYVVCAYTGLFTKKGAEIPQAANTNRMAEYTCASGVIDASDVGGICVRFNQAHGTAANMASMEMHEEGLPYLLPIKDSLPGTEGCYDYLGCTDDRHDILMNVQCACKGQALNVKVFGHTIELGKCTKRLIKYQRALPYRKRRVDEV